MQPTNIGWTDESWNPVTGCTKVSTGCKNCYAETIANRYKGGKGFPKGFSLQLRPDRLHQPIHMKKPRMIFVNSMSDLFHENIPDYYIRQVWDTMVAADQHIYQILTKRPYRMRDIIRSMGLEARDHIWLGTSMENQRTAYERMIPLKDIEGFVRFVSCEPLLGEISLSVWLDKVHYDDNPRIDWVIAGGESGAGRRPAEARWFRTLRDTCQIYDVPFFLKQMNHYRPGQDRVLDGRVHDGMPKILEEL